MDPTTAPAPLHKDRSVGLVVFGVFEITIGAILSLMTVLILASAALVRALPNQNPALATRSLFQSMVLYAVLSAFFVWVGIGSIRARRWARALMLVMSSLWMIVGVPATIAIAFIMPAAMRAAAHGPTPMPASLAPVVTIVAVIFSALFLVAMPAGFFAFYRSPHVKATCERKDPIVRWTDRVPLPVLALVVMSAWGAVSHAMMAYSTPILPVFGTFLVGWPASLGCLALAATWSVLGVGIYRLRMGAWWGVVGLLVVLTLSSVQSFMQGGLMDAYARLGVPEQQLVMLREMGMSSSLLPLVLLAFMLPFIGYVVWLRRFFVAGESR